MQRATTMEPPRAAFSNDSRIVKTPLPKSVLLKDYLLDDLSSCSSNGFRSYPRRQCCTKVRYLIEIDLNKHVKLPQKQKQLPRRKSKPKLKSKSKSKLRSRSFSVLHRASAAVVNVFKSFQFSGSGMPKKACVLPRNLSRKLSKQGFWKRTTGDHKKEFKRLNSFDEPIKRKKIIVPPESNVSAVVTTTTTAEMKTSTSNSNSFASTDSYFTATSDSSTTGGFSKINAAQNDVDESDQLSAEKVNMAAGDKVAVATATASATNANGNEKKQLQSEEKDQLSPVSVMEFPCDDEDEVTSPYKHSYLYVEGSKRKLMHNVQRSKRLAQLKPVRLEDRITLSETRTHGLVLESPTQSQQECATEENQIEKRVIALLQLLKLTLPSHDLSESKITESVLLEFFTERVTEGNVSNYSILQEAKDWVNGQTKEMLDCEYNKAAYIIDMEKGVKWFKYDDEVEKGEVGLELEYEVFTSLVEEMLLDFYL